MNITGYCGSSMGSDPAFENAARELGEWIAREGHSLVYGGSAIGLMGIVAGAALEGGAFVTGVEPRFFQSGCEGELCHAIHEAMDYAAGIVLNAGAYTHYSYAILDALLLAKVPTMEVHISDVDSREPFRRVSVIRPACVGRVAGLGLDSYLVGLERLVREHVRPG